MDKLVKIAGCLFSVTILLTVLFVGTYLFIQPQQSMQSTRFSYPSFLDVHIEPHDNVKLHVNETQVFTVIVNNGSVSFNYEWTVTPSDNNTNILANDNQCNFTFVNATEEPYMLNVRVQDIDVGNYGYDSVVIYDPYASPDLYLNAFAMPYSYLIEADGLGWYHAVNGTTGAIAYSGTNATQICNNAFAITDGNFLLKSGTYTLTGRLTPDSNDILLGEGWSTVLEAANGLNDHVIYVSGSSNVIIKNLKIDGNKDEQTSEPDDTAGIKFYDCEDSLIENVYINEVKGRGVWLYQCVDCHILNSKAISCGTDFQQGFTIEYSIHCTMNTLYALNCRDESFILAMSNSSSIINCVGEATEYDAQGIGGCEVFGIETVQSHHCTVMNLKLINIAGSFGINKAVDTTVDGLVVINPRKNEESPTMSGMGFLIYSSYSRNVTATNIEVHNPENCGIKITFASDIILSNIRIYGGVTTSTELYIDGIHVTDAANNVQIYNYYCYGFSGYNAIRFLNATNFILNGFITTKSRSNGVKLTDAYNGIISNGLFVDEETGIVEDDDCDYNMISNINARDCAYLGIVKGGANTKVNLCWNATVWIP